MTPPIKNRQKIYRPAEIPGLLKQRHGITVLTGGCFDILHAGHIRHLQAARALGDLLIVAVDDDATVRQSKGPGHPFMKLEERMEILSGLECVDFVTSQSEKHWTDWLRQLSPDIYAKGKDWDGHLPKEEYDAVTRGGGKVVFVGEKIGSSTQIIESLVAKVSQKV